MTSKKPTLSSTVAAIVGHLSPRGREVLSPLPHSPNVSNRRMQSETDRIRGIIRGERLKQEMQSAGKETFDEADDFDVDDDFDPSSPFEEIFDPVAAKAAREKPLPVKPADKDTETSSGNNDPERKDHAIVQDKTYSGSSFGELVSFIREAPTDVIDKLFTRKPSGNK